MDKVEQAILNDIERHSNGCWTWSKPRNEVNIIRFLAELHGSPLPAGVNMFRMPECQMGATCVNPGHVGTYAQWVERKQHLTGKALAPATSINAQDEKFLKSLRISL